MYPPISGRLQKPSIPIQGTIISNTGKYIFPGIAVFLSFQHRIEQRNLCGTNIIIRIIFSTANIRLTKNQLIFFKNDQLLASAIAAIASTTTGQRRAMQASCRPLTTNSSIRPVAKLNVYCFFAMLEVGLTAMRNTTGLPFEIPPLMPPAPLVAVFPLRSQNSRYAPNLSYGLRRIRRRTRCPAPPESKMPGEPIAIRANRRTARPIRRAPCRRYTQ